MPSASMLMYWRYGRRAPSNKVSIHTSFHCTAILNLWESEKRAAMTLILLTAVNYSQSGSASTPINPSLPTFRPRDLSELTGYTLGWRLATQQMRPSEVWIKLSHGGHIKIGSLDLPLVVRALQIPLKEQHLAFWAGLAREMNLEEKRTCTLGEQSRVGGWVGVGIGTLELHQETSTVSGIRHRAEGQRSLEVQRGELREERTTIVPWMASPCKTLWNSAGDFKKNY